MHTLNRDPRFNYITPEDYVELCKQDKRLPQKSAGYYRNVIKENKNKACINCGQPVWMLGELEMCFTCVTGEADPSDDYELIE